MNKLPTSFTKMFKFSQQGQAVVLAVIVLVVLMFGIMALALGSYTFKSNSKYNLDKLDAQNLADAGIDKAVATFNAGAGNYNGESETALGVGTYEVSVTTINSSTKLIQATGYVPNKADAKSKKTVSVQLSKGEGIAFAYGVQVGDGGLLMQQSTTVNGSIYSNGSITMSNNARVTGDAYVAGGVQPTPDAQNDCTVPNCGDFTFGRVNNQELDLAQEFTPTQNAVINKVELKLRKVGNPSDITVRILGDLNGKPNKNDVKTNGPLYASLVTSQYSWVQVAFVNQVTLSAGTPYWIVLDTSSNSSNYWQWSTDTLGVAGSFWSPDWQKNPSPTWNSISGDLNFRTYMGGVVTSISGATGATIGGNAHANTLSDLTVTGGAYYQSISSVTAGSYYPASTDPTVQVMPISDANIQEWTDAADGPNNDQTQTGNITTCVDLPSKKYIGDITLPGSCISNVDSPIWITGNLTLGNGAQMKLQSNYGATSGVVVVEGKVLLDNNAALNGSGTSGSYLMALSNFDSTQNGEYAIEAFNGSNSTILYSNKGIIFLHNNASLTEVTGWRIVLDNNAVVTYTQGLSSTFFSSGPTGSYSVVKGTYQSK